MRLGSWAHSRQFRRQPERQPAMLSSSAKYTFRQARARGCNAASAMRVARQHDAKITEWQTAKTAWEAEPDKRRYAAGGSANRPKFPEMYARDPSDHVPDGYRLFGFLADEGTRHGLCDSPDFGYYTDEWQDNIYYPCLLIRRTSEPHVWACIPAYYDATAEFYVFTDRNPRDLARSNELFDTSDYGQGSREMSGYSLCRDARDAAISALRIAESAADDEREYNERWNAASRANDERDDARETIRASRDYFHKLLGEVRAAGEFSPMVCDTLRARLRALRRDVSEAAATIRAATETIADADMDGEFPA